MFDLFDENNLFIFDDESVKISPVSKMPFRKKPLDSLNVRSKSNSNKSLPRIGHMWLPKMQPLAEPVAKWIPKKNFEDDYFQEIINLDFKKIDSLFKETSSLKPYVSNVILEKIIIDLENEVMNLLEKEKANLETIESLKSKGFELSENAISESENQSENECDKVEHLKVIAPGMFKLNFDTFSSVRRPKHSGVIWKKKGSSNTFNVDLSSDSRLKLNKNVKRYSRKDLLACNNSYLGETSNASLCNDAMNVSCNSRMCDLLDDNNFLIFDDESVKISPVSKMPFRKNPCDFMNVRSKSNMTESLPRTRVRIDNGMEFKNKTLAKFFDEVGITQQFSAARTPQQNGVVERRNRTFVEAARTILTFANLPSFLWAEAIAIDCFTQNRLIIHKRFNKTPYELKNKRKPNIKFFRVFGCRCYLLNDYKDVRKLKAKGDIRVFVGYSKEKDLKELFHNFYDEYFDSSKIIKSLTTNVETSINEEDFHEVFESFQRESSLSSLNDDVQQSPEEVILPQTNTQSISNNMTPNVDVTSTSHNVFNERLEDAYFDASTSFHDPSNVHNYYQPYPHEKK
nr:retrovirus-related Pol polyprotein from transposon TNT 1-94 [Tanacetum cinerariifolium]